MGDMPTIRPNGSTDLEPGTFGTPDPDDPAKLITPARRPNRQPAEVTALTLIDRRTDGIPIRTRVSRLPEGPDTQLDRVDHNTL